MIKCFYGVNIMHTRFEYYIETENFHLKYATGEPMLKGEEFHNYHEFVFFLGGNSRLISKNIQLDLSLENIIMIPKNSFHQFVILNPDKYTRCILGFRETPELFGLINDIMTDVKVILQPQENVLSLFYNLMDVAKSDLSREEKKMFIQASLIHLLVFFKKQPPNVVSRNINISPEVCQALHFIDKNFMDNISINSIADTLHISPSTLSHKFSRELNIPVYKYITEKRLSYVHKLLENGKNLYEAASMSGFGDYSGFFRMYKKRYGKVPSKNK